LYTTSSTFSRVPSLKATTAYFLFEPLLPEQLLFLSYALMPVVRPSFFSTRLFNLSADPDFYTAPCYHNELEQHHSRPTDRSTLLPFDNQQAPHLYHFSHPGSPFVSLVNRVPVSTSALPKTFSRKPPFDLSPATRQSPLDLHFFCTPGSGSFGHVRSQLFIIGARSMKRNRSHDVPAATFRH